ncbi:MAG: alpha/beta fold hydrolase [Anaerolineaceae bacterium]|nr:alpha/beta fold hydrolase [Anaerolineaceae bacterium]
MTFIHLPHGDIYFDTYGCGDPLLLLQGNTASSASLHASGDIQYFSQYMQTIVFDNRGTGKSVREWNWPIEWYQQCAQDAIQILDLLGIKQCRVIGSSGGALVGFWLAVLDPDRIVSLIVDSFGLDYKYQMPAVIRDTRSNYNDGQIAFWRSNHGDDWQQVVEADTDFILRFAAAQTGEQVDIPLEIIQCPVLISGSESDDLVPNVVSQADITAKRIRKAKIYLHATGEHPFMWSEPEAFREQARIFFDF